MPKASTKPTKDEIATMEKDIDIFAGWVNRLENPDPVLRTEAAGKGLKLYDEVDRDAHAGAVLQTRYLSVVGKEWEVIPAEGTVSRGRPGKVTQEQKIADFVTEVFLSTNFDQARQEQLAAILYGYYPGEVMWEYSEGDIWISKILSKHPRRFIFTPERELRLLTRSSMIEGEQVPERKFVVFAYGSSDNPYGKGLGQKLWWPVWFKKNGIKFWLIFTEKFGMPTALGKYPPGTQPDQQDALLSAIDAIQNETGVKIPDTMAIEFLEAKRTGRAMYEVLCNYMDRQISKCVLGQTLTTEVGEKGSYAAGRVHEDVRQDILKADADALCECYNQTLVRWIVDYNFGPQKAYPKLWIRTEAEQDLKELAERDKIIFVDMGMGKRVPESYITETYNIPLAEEDEPVIGVPPKGQFAEEVKPTHFQAPGDFTADQRALERMVERSLKGAQKPLEGLINPLIKIIEKAESFEQIQSRLAEAFPQMQPAEFEDLVARCLFAAEMWGRYQVDKEREGAGG